MIDLHNHILPAIDDGAQDLEMTQAMLEQFASLGFSRLVATPHLKVPLTEQASAAAHQRLESVREIAASLNVTVDLGYEHVIAGDTLDRLDRGEPTTLAGSRAVLLETPSFSWPGFADSVLFELQIAGYRPILAHPERYHAIQHDPEIALLAAACGIVLQITTSSFAGTMGRDAQRTAQLLLTQALDRQLLVVFSSDAHSDGQRLTKVADGLEWIRKHFQAGDEIIGWATQAVPAALLDPDERAGAVLEELRVVPAGWANARGRGRRRFFGSSRKSVG